MPTQSERVAKFLCITVFVFTGCSITRSSSPVKCFDINWHLPDLTKISVLDTVVDSISESDPEDELNRRNGGAPLSRSP